jgi:hypothetical protein
MIENEADWLWFELDPEPLVEFLRGRASERKLRLFSCACWRRLLPVRWINPTRSIDPARLLEVLARAEQVAEGTMTAADFDAWVEALDLGSWFEVARLQAADGLPAALELADAIDDAVEQLVLKAFGAASQAAWDDWLKVPGAGAAWQDAQEGFRQKDVDGEFFGIPGGGYSPWREVFLPRCPPGLAAAWERAWPAAWDAAWSAVSRPAIERMEEGTGRWPPSYEPLRPIAESPPSKWAGRLADLAAGLGRQAWKCGPAAEPEFEGPCVLRPAWLAFIGHDGVSREVRSELSSDVLQTEEMAQAYLLHDIFGNPFRPVALDPRWRTSPVVDLARTIYDERAFARVPVLADALRDAGCDQELILYHCREEGPHVRGCWVVDLVLGKQ